MRMGRQMNCSGMPVYDNNVCTLKMEAQIHGGDPEFYNDTFTCKAFQETISPGWFIDILWCMNGVDFVSINFGTLSCLVNWLWFVFCMSKFNILYRSNNLSEITYT